MTTNQRSYERLAKERFGITPNTPYGFFLSNRNALLLNVGPGDGTLVHELVHPFVHENLPNAPAWLNETKIVYATDCERGLGLTALASIDVGR